jgi:hypothetical protein
MTDRLMFVGWGQVVRGREERALEVFNEALALYGRMQQDGRIESFDVAFLDPHAGGLDGYIALRCSGAQLAALYDDEEFRRLQTDVSLIVDDLRVVAGYAGEGVARQAALFSEAVARAPQHA